ncbi:hypothetical protein VIGAN_03065200 [Vigna angularis var. angularis]|nr:hypothetical protein VIGAN_03065200 [Vigna angularis var. angularis]
MELCVLGLHGQMQAGIDYLPASMSSSGGKGYSWDEGKSGFGVYKFRLSRIEGQAEMGSVILKEARNIRRDDDRDPLNYEYLAMTSFPQFVFHQSGNVTGCDCVNGCGDGCFCAMKMGVIFLTLYRDIL